MYRKFQQGELSLLWAAVVVGLVSLLAMIALMSMRHERNYFSEAWQRLARSDVGQALQQTRLVAESAVKQESAEVRKCVIDGRVVYSNVECDMKNSTRREVDLHDTKGFEAPKLPPAAAQTDGSMNMQDKMIEKAISAAR